MTALKRTADGKPTAEYVAWAFMKQVCFNPNHKNYRDYGGRGITVHPELMSFEGFVREVGPKPSPALTLDRLRLTAKE